MNATMTGKHFLDALGADLSALLERGMEWLFGSGVNDQAFGSVTWADLGAMGFFLLFVLLVNGLAAAILAP